MVFSSTVFLFLFLPFVLGLHFLLKKSLRNPFILICSLFFYAWGENILVLLMIISICINYIFGILISISQANSRESMPKWALTIGVTLNLLILIYYKYINFILENLMDIGIKIDVDVSTVALPIGVSFFTFQNISYLVDVYRKEVDSQKNLVHLGLYISLFPQLIAGPIVRYIDIFQEIKNRTITKELFSSGVTKFIGGLAKKVLIANTAGLIADKAFNISPTELSTPVAWLAILCYTMQIYFDFSGYSDMAIGLGRMLGFRFKENFNYPYISQSIQEFWRRWHISLSTWFRDYLYIPLGGNRKGKYWTYINLVIVFFITGLWHGASWNYVIWGLYHGLFIILERTGIISFPGKLWFLKRFYLLLVVIIGWVFFRIEDLNLALLFIKKLFSFSSGSNNYPLMYLDRYTYFVLLAGILFSTPIKQFVSNKVTSLIHNDILRATVKYSAYLILFVFTILELAQTTFNPFIYFRF